MLFRPNAGVAAARNQAEQASLGFALGLPDDEYTQVHRLLDLTGLGTAFAIFPTLDDASAAARSGHTGTGRVPSR